MRAPEHVAVPAPIRRHPLRKWAGIRYFRLRRWWQWQWSGQTWARKRPGERLPVVMFSHATPLLRQLKDVDMWLQHNKVQNLKIAVSLLDGVVIRPGETFSYWRLLGKPTARRGFVPGLQLDQGQLKTAIGGGLCQMSNLIFWMVLHSPLTIVERWRHSYDVFPDVNRTQPFGSGATCAYNYIDLQLRNDTEQDIQLNLWLSEEHLHGSLSSEYDSSYTYEVFESDHLFRPEMWGGYTRHNRIARRVLNRGTSELLYEEPMVENHAVMMYNPTLQASNS